MKYEVIFKNLINNRKMYPYTFTSRVSALEFADRWLEVNPHTEARIFNAETGIEIYRKQN